MAETKSEVSLDRKLGLAVATAVIIVMYLIFTFAYTELACAIPKAGELLPMPLARLVKTWAF